MQKGTTFVAHVHVYVYCSKSDISNNIMIFITANTPRCTCDEAYGSQFVYLCVYLCIYVCNLDFSKVTKNQALVNAVQVQCNILNLAVLDI